MKIKFFNYIIQLYFVKYSKKYLQIFNDQSILIVPDYLFKMRENFSRSRIYSAIQKHHECNNQGRP